MKLEIISEKDNPLRKRKEYWLMADHADKETPSRHAMLPEVARKLGIKEELILLDKIFSERGTAKSRVKVLVYNDKKEVPKDKLERQVRKINKFLEKKEAAAAVPPEPAAEAPGESGEVQSEDKGKSEEKQTEDATAEEPKGAETEEKPKEKNKEEPEEKSEEKKEEKTAEETPAEEPKEEEKPAEEPKEDAPSEESKEEANKE